MFPLFIFLLISVSGMAEEYAGKSVMNDINFSEYKDFQNKWSLVTIRFRKDTGEMRLTYANELAMKTLMSGAINYPDGAVFAKMGFHTGSDPQFESSVVPNGIRRYQFMVKNRKLYKSTNGWGYGLFDPDGKTFPEEPKAAQDACFACHTIVENRGDVFSQPFSHTKDAKLVFMPFDDKAKGIRYQTIKLSSLPENLRKLVPKNFKQIRMVSNKQLRQNLFQGTLDEMKPVLEVESRRSKLPALFSSPDHKRFVLLVPTRTDACMQFGGFDVSSTDLQSKITTSSYCTHD